MYESGDDMDKATTYKMEASDLKGAGDYSSALEKYNLAITAAPPSALLLANRGDTLCRLGQYEASVRDCDAALEKNPDRYVIS
jgi:suppressor of tumorigenicity protein 13